MPQKALKVKPKEKKRERITKKQQNPKNYAPKIIKAKNPKVAAMDKLSKVHSVTTSTEKLIASRVGHLELLTGSRREIERQQKLEKKKAAEKKK
ncbi:hypothetical protein BN7_281 [Wickerhamomyces ciferrii]|uniref:Uncharacterized protein n=1 Tax=Wickerhamomyces ciferrii (strain ATCC 14091 / BCRC 22168 / CBS 111 / JCM 3599 / NBRC 0793 / NRRL Y-1031 F-60-10) TaxID=1206466 RepID=K0KEW0_WICCF|nr:uncharacterized protein BN7_281 [Wickerhamomyces ciferrii]CCH40747.1 hypothetical protein BN7_281 [Wickerhamomyces ciferrii]